jgi:cytochrome b561
LTLPDKYTKPAVILHWLIAIGILFNAGKMLVTADDARTNAVFDLHKSIGITVLGLVALRILWRAANKPPALPATYKPWESKLSHWIHYLLYALVFAIPFSGWLHDSAWKAAAKHPLVLFHAIPWFRLPLFNGMDPATKDQWHELLGSIHGLLTYGLLTALALHVLGALKHQFLDKEKEIQRMWF